MTRGAAALAIVAAACVLEADIVGGSSTSADVPTTAVKGSDGAADGGLDDGAATASGGAADDGVATTGGEVDGGGSTDTGADTGEPLCFPDDPECDCGGGDQCWSTCSTQMPAMCNHTCAGDANYCMHSCLEGACNLECLMLATCVFDCAPGAFCAATCDGASACTQYCRSGNCGMSCTDTETCTMSCPEGGCMLDCQGATSCTITDCDSMCQLDCGGAPDCSNSCGLAGLCSTTP